MLIRVAREVDLCGSLIDIMTSISIGVVQDELVSHIIQKLVCHSYINTELVSAKLNKNSLTLFFFFFFFVPPIFCLVPSNWQEPTVSVPVSFLTQIFLWSSPQTDRW